MPQLNKTNILLTFFCTWLALLFISIMTKSFNPSVEPYNKLASNETLPWHWPYN